MVQWMRCVVAWTVCLSVLTFSASSHRQDHNDGKSEQKLICYYSNWAVYRPGLAKFTPENINPYLCTHIIYAFASLSEDFHVQPFDPYNDMEQGNYRSFVSLKAYNPQLKTMIAVGGWNEGSRRFSKLVESVEHRRTFVSSALAFLRQHSFDGLDLDWEYPAFREGGNTTTDKKGYALLVKELRQAIEDEKLYPEKERLILSVAIPATKEYIDQGFDVPELSRYADFLNLLTYDYHTAYESQTHHHAPLHPPEGEDSQLNVAWTVNYYLSLGAPSHKLILGIPMYGRSYTLASPQTDTGYDVPVTAPGEEGAATREKGYMAFYEICQKVKEEDWEVEAPFPLRVGPYAYKDDQWVGFDDEEMVFNKALYILERGLGGAMVWTLDNDDFRGLCTGEQSPLVNTLRDVLLNSNLIAGSSSQRSVARAAHDSHSEVVRFDDDLLEEGTTPPPRRRNTLRRLVQNRQRDRQVDSRRLSADVEENEVLSAPTTPPPPPTPDPAVSFECQDEGFFNNPRDCRKYFWCLDSGPANLGVVAHAFTCPSGLHFNSGSESCDYPDNIVCPVGSVGATAVKTTTKPRTRTTTTTTTTTTFTTTTTTPAPTTTTEEPDDDSHVNIAELLRLLQAIGGVDRLQSLLGAQEEASSVRKHNTLVPYQRSGPVNEQPDLFLDPYDVRGAEDTAPDVEDTLEEFPFQYNPPPRTAHVTPEVIYVKEKDSQPEVPPYEVPLKPTSTAAPYRTPIRVQVGRVVRVQNGTPTLTGNNNIDAGRRRMLVRVRPLNRTSEAEIRPPVEEPVNEVTGRAVGRDDRKLSGSSILATRAHPNDGGRVAIHRQPIGSENNERRLNAIADRNPITVRKRPTTPQITSPPTTTTSTTTTTTPSAPIEAEDGRNTKDEEEYEDDEYEYYDYEDETTTAATTTRTTAATTTTTTKRPNRRRFTSAPATSTTSTRLSSSSAGSNRRGGSSTTPRPSTTPTRPPVDDGPALVVRSDSEVECFKRGVFIHPTECSKFVVCAPASRASGQALKGRVLNCPANQIYLVDIGRCMKGDRNKCQKL